MQKEQFGMMDEGYFVPKSQILVWLNELLKINISKIQALGSGAIYCQLIDVIHPGKINLQKVNWKAKNDNEFLSNFRLLQSAVEKVGIKRHIEVQKLVKAKYQDNLQLIQWFKRYFDLNCGSKGQGYDAVEKRNKVVPDFGFAQKTIVPKVYSGSGQVQPKPTKKLEEKPAVHQKKQQSPKQAQTEQKESKTQKTPKTVKSSIEPKTDLKNTIKAPVKPPSTAASHTTRVKPQVKEKKQQPSKSTQTPTSGKKQDGMKKKPVTVHQQPVKKVVQSTSAVKNNLSTVHHGVQSSGVKGKQHSKTNEQKIKQLQGKIESIKSMVVSGKQSELIVGEIRQLLGLNLLKQEKKVEQHEKEENLLQGQHSQHKQGEHEQKEHHEQTQHHPQVSTNAV